MSDDHAGFVERVRAYYETVTPAYLECLGTSIQAGLVGGSGDEDYRGSNLRLAARAGIQPGHRVLDAGCGVCGPSIDIAEGVDGVEIDAVTVSPLQRDLATSAIAARGLSGRIHVHCGDYHRLPFAAARFDVVFMFESFGYSYDPPALCLELSRVLKPGGVVYIKDIFRLEDLGAAQREALARFDRAFAQRTPALSVSRGHFEAAGFHVINCGELSASFGRINQAMWQKDARGQKTATTLGALHAELAPEPAPIYCGELRAEKRKG